MDEDALDDLPAESRRELVTGIVKLLDVDAPPSSTIGAAPMNLGAVVVADSFVAAETSDGTGPNGQHVDPRGCARGCGS